MSVKKTIGIIDSSQKLGTEIALQLANTECRLLLISNNAEKLKLLTEDLIGKHPLADIDFVVCAKDGCWEADVIILTMSEYEKSAIAEKMKEVAIQKTVVTISDERNPNNNLQSLLPYSKLIHIYWKYPFKELEVYGKDADVLEEISNIFQQAGFFTKSELKTTYSETIQ